MTVSDLLATTLLLWGAGAVYTLPLAHRPGYARNMVLWLLAFLPVRWMMAELPTLVDLILPYLGNALLLTAMIATCVRQHWMSVLYCMTWAMLSAHATQEVYLLLAWNGVLPANPWWTVVMALPVYLLLWATLARHMPSGDQYDIGPRQLSSALLLNLLFEMLYEIVMLAPGVREPIILPAMLAQVYCLTLLYLQTELFKKSAIQKELDTLNLLYDLQKKQYNAARRNVQLIYRKCHELKVQIAALRADPNALQGETLQQAESAVRRVDATMNTGNDVLDVVLTEKALACEEKHITMNCVADGAALDFFEPAELYVLFSSALDNAIEAVETLEVPKRLIDVLVSVRQDFLVINIINPLRMAPDFEGELPAVDAQRRLGRGYGLKNIRRIVRQYGGMLDVKAEDGFFTLRIVIPVREEMKHH